MTARRRVINNSLSRVVSCRTETSVQAQTALLQGHKRRFCKGTNGASARAQTALDTGVCKRRLQTAMANRVGKQRNCAQLPTILLLAAASMWSWWQIFLKMFQLRRTSRDTDRFEDEFWKGGDLNELYQRASQARVGGGTGAHLHRRLPRILQAPASRARRRRSTLDSARRAMRAAVPARDRCARSASRRARHRRLGSPYIGLFGTVWGIMNAFRGLANVSQATLAQVAPGIAEALIATAIGLFAAIPAVVAYNRYTHDVDRLASATRRSSRSSRTSCSGRA